MHSDVSGTDAKPELDEGRLIELDDDKNIKQRYDQHDGRHHQPEKQKSDVRRLAAIPCLHKERARLLLADPFVQIEPVYNRLHVLLGRAAETYLLTACQSLAFALANFLAFYGYRRHALAQRVGCDERHGQGEHGCDGRDGCEHHRHEASVEEIYDQEVDHDSWR